MPERRLHALARGGHGSQVFYFHTWYRGHNNPRYDELLPRLSRVDAYLVRFPRPRVARAAAERAWKRVRFAVEPPLLARASAVYGGAFVTDLRQLPHLRVPCVVDVDDPQFERDAELLRSANVAAYVVTDEYTGHRLEALGVDQPWHVVPQGAPLDRLDAGRVEAIRRTRRREGDFVAVFVSAFLLLPGDRGGDNPLYDVTHLLELWDQVAARAPGARLWLIGHASPRARERLRGRGDVVLLGRLHRNESFAHIAAADVALYPRRPDDGVRRVKTAEYLAAGVPVVGYDYRSVSDVKEAGAGLLVDQPADFVDAVVSLARDGALRARLAAAAAGAGAQRDWRILSARYASILDEHLR
ncbi:MAG TPA: glycosyltransferase [Gaiellaceae bacterium]